MPDLKTLIEKAKKNDDSFREIYLLTVDRVFGYVFLRLKNKETAKDVVQEVYLALWQSLSKFVFSSEQEFWGFLWKIVRSKVFRARKKKLVNTCGLEEALLLRDNTEFNEDYRFLFRAIDGLKEKQKVILELRYFQGFSFAEVANAVGLSETNVKVIHHRALKLLANKLVYV